MQTIRKNLYQKSGLIQNNHSNIIEIFGGLSLTDKYKLWSEYGEPIKELYFSADSARVVCAEDLEEIDLGWSVGWISGDNTVFIMVNSLDSLISYYLSETYDPASSEQRREVLVKSE